MIEEEEGIISTYVNTNLEWNKEFKFTAELMTGIKDSLNWTNPSRIQARAIPLIVNPDYKSGKHKNLIAQSRNGSGKSGAFIIGSILRVDPSIKKVQVIMIGLTRELVNQISSVVSRILKHIPSYKVCNLATDRLDNKSHIIVSTVG